MSWVTRSLIVGLLLATVAPQQLLAVQPTAVIKPDGDITVAVGEMVILDGSSSQFDPGGAAWVLDCGKPFYSPKSDPSTAVFSSGTPGRYTFALFTGGMVDGQLKIARGTKLVTVTGHAPDPVPVPPLPVPPTPVPPVPVPVPPVPVPPAPVPVPLTDLAQAVYNNAMQVDSAARGLAAGLADNLTAVANDSSMVTPQQMSAAVLAKNAVTLGASKPAWSAFAIAIQAKLDAIWSSGVIKGTKDWADVFNQMATGLRAVK